MSATLPLIYEELVVFPTSLIKSPGSLLRKNKSEDYPSFQRSNDSTQCESIHSPLSMDHIVLKNSMLVKPLEKQLKMSDYNIEFKSFFGSSMTDFALDCIMDVLRLLPQSFIMKLHMKIILTDHPTIKEEKHCLRSFDLRIPKKVQSRLYSIMFNSLLTQFPNLLSFWGELSDQHSNQSQYASDEVQDLLRLVREKALESSFYAIMFNKAYPIGLNIARLKELLMILDPESFSPEWFKNHNRELKKGYKVRFSDDESE